MTIHTPQTVIERHRYGYDVFPDSNRTQPFGSSANFVSEEHIVKNSAIMIYSAIIEDTVMKK